MLRIFLSILFLFLLSSCSSQPTLHDSNGNRIHLSDYRGKWIIINYWAAWCKPCILEMPELNSFYQLHKDKVMVLGVNYDQAPASELPKLIVQVGAKFPVLINLPPEEFGVKQVEGLPMTLLINPQGKLQEILMGEQTRLGLEKKIGI
jgi:thiol-disulfide isomerase/thioredoxin